MFGLLFAVALSTIAARVPAVTGVMAIDLIGGRTTALRADERFPMGSVYKFPIALAVLREVDRGKLKLDTRYTIAVSDFSAGVSPIRDRAKGKPITVTLRELVRAMLGDSDNTACDFLLKVVPPDAVTKYLRDIGVNDIDVNRSENEIARDIHATTDGVARYAKDRRDSATPRALAMLLQRFARGEDGLSRANHDFAMQTMIATPTSSKRIKGLLPKGAVVAHKTGTMPGTLNDVGIVSSADGNLRFVIAVLTKESAQSVEARERMIAQITRAVWDDWRATP
jgi:beta-lactamase class A